MLIIGLTGSFGTGKTFVGSIFKALGAKVIDADAIARKVLSKGSPAYKKVISLFGEKVLDKRRDIDRRALARIIFKDKKNVEHLNRITHPQIIRRIRKEIFSLRGKAVIVLDAPLLIEAGLRGLCDKLIVVKASRERQIERCMKKFNIKKDDVLKRIRCQIPLERKARIADFVIDNDGTKAETVKQVKTIWKNVSRNMAL